MLLLGAMMLVASGALPAFSAFLQGSLERLAPYAPTFRLLTLLWAIAWIVQLLGFGLLVRPLLWAGNEQLAIPVFTLILVAAFLGLFHATFNLTVMLWAVQEAAQTGSVPEIYEPLRAWSESSMSLAYHVHLVAVAGFGWALLRAKLLSPWVGWVTIGWSAFWLVGSLIDVGAPGILFVMPGLVGVTLLWKLPIRGA